MVRSTTTLLLLPGLDGTEIFFRPLMAALPAWVKPLVVTYPTSGVNDYSHLLAVVQQVIDNSPSRTLYVLGWSFSGPLALMLAAKRPTRIQGVILCASFVRPPHPILPWIHFAVTSPVVHLVRLARRTPIFLFNDPTDRFCRDKAATWARVPTRTLTARARAILTLDARDSLRECPRPLLYLAGSRDWTVSRRNVAELVRELPSAQVVTIDGPHLALYTNSIPAAHAITEFMRESATAPETESEEAICSMGVRQSQEADGLVNIRL